MIFFTIGYGGRSPDEFLSILQNNGVRSIVDVRLRPDKAYKGTWVKAQEPGKGIEKILADVGIEYLSLPELGNIFLDYPDSLERYGQLLEIAGHLLFDRMTGIQEPFCLLCAEKMVSNCHRGKIAEYLVKTRGYEVVHL